LAASDLRLDESILTGESEPAGRTVGQEVRSGAFVVEGTGGYEVTAVGAESYAARLTGEARSFRHPRSPLELAVNRLLYALVGLVVGLGAILGYSLYHRHVPLNTAVSTSSAGVRRREPRRPRASHFPVARRMRGGVVRSAAVPRAVSPSI
jgi:cation-transporting ATPase E